MWVTMDESVPDLFSIKEGRAGRQREGSQMGADLCPRKVAARAGRAPRYSFFTVCGTPTATSGAVSKTLVRARISTPGAFRRQRSLPRPLAVFRTTTDEAASQRSEGLHAKPKRIGRAPDQR